MSEFKRTGKLTVSGSILSQAQSDFISASVHGPDVESTISSYYQKWKYLLDPHTAVGVAAAERLENKVERKEGEYAIVCLSTAHPAKFGEVVTKCVGSDVNVVDGFEPARKLLAESEGKRRCRDVAPSVDDVKQLILNVLEGKS